MKFTKEDAFKQIEGYLTDNGKKDLLLSKRSINAQIESLMPLLADDETELSVFVEKVKPTFQTMWGNLKYDTAQFVKKWKDEHPENEAEETPAPTATAATDALLQRIEKLESDLAKRDREAAVGSKRKQLADKLAEKGVKDPSWVNDLLSEVSVTEETDIESAAEKYVKLYNRVSAQTPPNITPNAPTGAAAKSSSFDDVKDIRKARGEAQKGMITNN